MSTPPATADRPPVSAPFASVEGRDVAALHDPRPVCLIGACGEDGTACFATVIWVTPVSHKPPMLAFALRAKSHTMSLLRASGAFSCATLPATAEAVALTEFCGGNTGRLVNKGTQVDHEKVPVRSTLVPVPSMALSWTTCTVDSIQEAGDHLLVVGTVAEAHIAADTPRDAHGRLTPTDTLLCIQHGAYAQAKPLSRSSLT